MGGGAWGREKICEAEENQKPTGKRDLLKIPQTIKKNRLNGNLESSKCGLGAWRGHEVSIRDVEKVQSETAIYAWAATVQSKKAQVNWGS